VRSLLLSEAARRALEPELALLDSAVPVYLAAPEDFARMTGINIHRGCLARAERPPVRPVDELLSGARTVVVMEAIANADNVGGVFRNALALGGDAVLLSPTCCDPLYRKAIRTSMGATLTIPFARIDDWPRGLQTPRASGSTSIALTPRESATLLEAFLATVRPGRVALLVGTEGAGLTATAERAADYDVRIPMRANADSLNVAVAVAIALYRLGAASHR
jgi:tRNA G18 (ribose-2'-O)-methylase SpoU